jgi:hypothetical protein
MQPNPTFLSTVAIKITTKFTTNVMLDPFQLDALKRHSVSIVVGASAPQLRKMADALARTHEPREVLRLTESWKPLDVNTLLAAQSEAKGADAKFRTAAMVVDVPNLDFHHVGVRMALCNSRSDNLDICVVANRCPRGAGDVLKHAAHWAFLTSPRRIHGEVGRLYATFGCVAFGTMKDFEAALLDATADRGFLAIDLVDKRAFKGRIDSLSATSATPSESSQGWLSWAASFLW